MINYIEISTSADVQNRKNQIADYNKVIYHTNKIILWNNYADYELCFNLVRLTDGGREECLWSH